MSAAGNEVKDTYQLQASLPDWCALKWYHAALCGLFVLFYLYFSYLPVPVLGVWHSVWSGGWIVENGLYATDPSLPLADGMRGITNGWLSKVALHYIHWTGGSNLISVVFAIIQTLTLCIWAFVFIKITRTWKAGFAAIFCSVACLLLVVGIEPRTFGELCFALMALVLTWRSTTSVEPQVDSNSKPFTFSIHWANAKIWQWIAMGAIMIAWTNLDASFVIGIVWLACIALGRLIDAVRGQNEFSISNDRELKYRLYLLEVMFLVTLVTPHGWDLWHAMLWWPDNPILSNMGGWTPTVLASWQGAAIGAAWAIWFVAAKRSTKLPTWTVLSSVTATVAAACCEVSLIWLAPTIMFASMALFASWQRPEIEEAKLETQSSSDAQESHQPLRFAFTLICGLLIWVGFSLSPISQPLLGGAERTIDQIVSKDAPLGMVTFIKQFSPPPVNPNSPNRMTRLVWAPQYWSDWMQAENRIVPVFANANLRALPMQVQADYLYIFQGEKSWKRVLDRYAITDLVIDKNRQTELYKNVRVDRGVWYTIYEDNDALVMRRKENRQLKTTQTKSRNSSSRRLATFGKASREND
ncbi:MAG: hypothetical protein AB8B55_17220 [Mariniblastus sp.]